MFDTMLVIRGYSPRLLRQSPAKRDNKVLLELISGPTSVNKHDPEMLLLSRRKNHIPFRCGCSRCVRSQLLSGLGKRSILHAHPSSASLSVTSSHTNVTSELECV